MAPNCIDGGRDSRRLIKGGFGAWDILGALLAQIHVSHSELEWKAAQIGITKADLAGGGSKGNVGGRASVEYSGQTQSTQAGRKSRYYMYAHFDIEFFTMKLDMQRIRLSAEAIEKFKTAAAVSNEAKRYAALKAVFAEVGQWVMLEYSLGGRLYSSETTTSDATADAIKREYEFGFRAAIAAEGKGRNKGDGKGGVQHKSVNRDEKTELKQTFSHMVRGTGGIKTGTSLSVSKDNALTIAVDGQHIDCTFKATNATLETFHLARPSSTQGLAFGQTRGGFQLIPIPNLLNTFGVKCLPNDEYLQVNGENSRLAVQRHWMTLKRCGCSSGYKATTARKPSPLPRKFPRFP